MAEAVERMDDDLYPAQAAHNAPRLLGAAPIGHRCRGAAAGIVEARSGDDNQHGEGH
jgi:hypothetical protein